MKIINISSNHHMKKLMDWLSFSQQWHPSERRPLLPSTAPFKEFTSHQLDLRRPTVHANLALKCERSEGVTPGHLSPGAYYVESSKPTNLLHFQPFFFIFLVCAEWFGLAGGLMLDF